VVFGAQKTGLSSYLTHFRSPLFFFLNCPLHHAFLACLAFRSTTLVEAPPAVVDDGRGRLAALTAEAVVEMAEVRFVCVAAGGGTLDDDDDCLGVAGVVVGGDSSVSMSSAF